MSWHYFENMASKKVILVLCCTFLGLFSPTVRAEPQFGVTFPDGKTLFTRLRTLFRTFWSVIGL